MIAIFIRPNKPNRNLAPKVTPRIKSSTQSEKTPNEGNETKLLVHLQQVSDWWKRNQNSWFINNKQIENNKTNWVGCMIHRFKVEGDKIYALKKTISLTAKAMMMKNV